MRFFLGGLVFFVLATICGKAQVINTATMDTLETTVLGHVAIGGYVDTYFAYNFTNRSGKYVPYAVSSSRNNEMNINLAYVDLRYRSHNLRARFVPGFGTYMNDNYKNEHGTLANVVEANVGVRLSERKNIWLDAGVLGSPYTNESAISKDHLMYTRSFAPENVPYYLSGVKVNWPVSNRISATVYLLNGWQVIEDNNQGKSIGTQLEFRPSKVMLINWNTYIGDERSGIHADYRTRYFSDIFWIYRPSSKFDATSCIYGGVQKIFAGKSKMWWQANLIGRYHFSEKASLSGRVEYFNDPERALVAPLTSVAQFKAFSTGLCLNIKTSTSSLFRLEAKEYLSQKSIFNNEVGDEVRSTLLLVANLTAWF